MAQSRKCYSVLISRIKTCKPVSPAHCVAPSRPRRCIGRSVCRMLCYCRCYTFRAGHPTGITIRLRGGVRFPTGGKVSASGSQARERLHGWSIVQGQQIWCEAKADGIVRMKEDVRYPRCLAACPQGACGGEARPCACPAAFFARCEERFIYAGP